MDNSFCIITISYSYCNQLNETVFSVNNFLSKIKLNFEEMEIGYILVVSEKLDIKEKKQLKKIFDSSNINSRVISGLDNGIYDAMNIGVNAAMEFGYEQCLFINSGSKLINKIKINDFKDFIFEYRDYVKLFGAYEYIPKIKKNKLLTPLSVKNWTKNPDVMPTAHQSIVYPTKLFANNPYISFQGMLASDYINLIYLLKINCKFISSKIFLTQYMNDGISSKKPYKSILQRYAGYYLITGKILKTIKYTLFWLAKTYLSRLIGIR